MHAIRLVDDSAMPEGQDFVFTQVGADHYIFYRASAITAETLEASWTAFRALSETPPPPDAWQPVVLVV